jgi:hypothetical protein
MSEHYIRIDNPEKKCTYGFFTGWTFIENLEAKGHNFDKIYLDVINRESNDFFYLFGYQEMSALAYMIVLDAVRPLEEKKHLARQREAMLAMSQKVRLSTLKTLSKAGWQWITLLTTFIAAVSVTLNWLVTLIA